MITQLIIPTYVTITFFIKNPNPPGEQLVTCSELERDQRSLDLTEWKEVLEEHGWRLIRPPRIRVFYVNDVLSIGAEIPASMLAMDDAAYLDAITNYTRAIASLVFPHINISELPVNSRLRDSFDKSKKNVGNGINAIHSQIVAALEGNFESILALYNKHHGIHLTISEFEGLDKSVVVIQMLKENNIGFLREFMPELINKDFSTIDNKQLLRIRDMCLLDYEINLTGVENIDRMISECDMILLKKEHVINSIQALSNEGFSDLLTAFNQANHSDYEPREFLHDYRFIVVMEMLNRNGNNIVFLRQVLPTLLGKNVSTFTDQAVFALRDHFTHGYMHSVDETLVGSVATTLVDQLITSGFNVGASYAEKLLQLATLVAKADIQGLVAGLGLPIITKKQDRQALSRKLLTIISAKVAEIDVEVGAPDHLLPQTSYILQMSRVDLLNAMQNMANEFATNKEIRHFALFSFFPRKHSNIINKFVKELRALVDNTDLTLEQLRFQLIDVVQRLHNTLEHGYSRRTLSVLNTMLAQQLPGPTKFALSAA